jgi:hypothetical protein
MEATTILEERFKLLRDRDYLARLARDPTGR